jgi:hypothetical protein
VSASLAVAAGLQFRPMDESDLAWVAAQDASSTRFPGPQAILPIPSAPAMAAG